MQSDSIKAPDKQLDKFRFAIILISILFVAGDIVGLMAASSLDDNASNASWIFVWLVLDAFVAWTILKRLKLARFLLVAQVILLIPGIFLSFVFFGISYQSLIPFLLLAGKGFTYTAFSNAAQ